MRTFRKLDDNTAKSVFASALAHWSRCVEASLPEGRQNISLRRVTTPFPRDRMRSCCAQNSSRSDNSAEADVSAATRPQRWTLAPFARIVANIADDTARTDARQVYRRHQSCCGIGAPPLQDIRWTRPRSAQILRLFTALNQFQFTSVNAIITLRGHRLSDAQAVHCHCGRFPAAGSTTMIVLLRWISARREASHPLSRRICQPANMCGLSLVPFLCVRRRNSTPPRHPWCRPCPAVQTCS